MILLDNGLGVQSENWTVNEQTGVSFSRVYCILSGDVTYNDIHGEKKLRTGHMYVFPAYLPYTIKHIPEFPINCLWLHMDFFPCQADRLLEYDIKASKTLYGIVEALISLGCFYRENNAIYIHLAQALGEYILRSGDLKILSSGFADVLKYIRVHCFDRGITVKAMSDYFGYSPEHFIRLFSAQTNSTPYRYMTELRMEKAVKLLWDDTDISEVAAQCGYCDHKSFARVFKKSFGVPPSEYRRFYTPTA